MGVHVHEMTLCVTFGARHFTDHVRFIMRCSKYIVICMVSETRVLQSTLCVTFGARLCSVPWGHLGRLVAAPAARNAQETPNGTVGHPFGVASIIRRSRSAPLGTHSALPTSSGGAFRTLRRNVGGYILASDGERRPLAGAPCT